MLKIPFIKRVTNKFVLTFEPSLKTIKADKCKCKCRGLQSEIPVASADFTIYTPGIGTLSYTVSSPLGRIQRIFCS